MHRNWLVNRTNPEFLRYLSATASISTVFAQVLVNRGLKDADSIKNFLRPDPSGLYDPFLLADMDRAVLRLRNAVKHGETVFIHGDYDADGLTSTALLAGVLGRLGIRTHYHIPNRISEGYGISMKGIEKAKACGATLIITADCGISAAHEVSMARSLGMDVIVTDHHEPPDVLPEAAAVIDPHRRDSQYPFKYLAGVGVAFKLLQALVRDMNGGMKETDLHEYMDLVALGTLADSVPLLEENRVFATLGLGLINSGPYREGIRALKKAASVEKRLSSGHVSFTMVPRINAAGRLDDAGEVVELLLTNDPEKADVIARKLDEQNRKRQKIEGEVLQSALSMIHGRHPDDAIVLSSPDWHQGVIGIVASRLVEMFYRPVFLFSVKDSVAKGSARGIPSFHLYNAIAECSDLLTAFGGHRQAAGLRMPAGNLNGFRERMNGIVNRELRPEDRIPVLEIDAAVNFTDLTFNLVNELELLGPYGESNREPLLGARNITVVNHRKVGNNHLKMLLSQDRKNLDTIGFNMADRIAKMGNANMLDIAFVPSINEWNGSKSLQLNLKAMRPGS